MPQTKLANLVDPEVMADMVSAKLPKKIKFSPIARIDTTLVGRPGSTIVVPKYAYIGDAEDVAEGVAMGTTVLTASTTEAKVKKAGKAVELTDESLLSGYGDPMGTTVNQIAMSIAAKVDNDCYDALCDAPIKYDGTAANISYSAVVSANSKFDDESDASLAKILFINPEQEATLLNDDDFKSNDKYPLDVIMKGTIGSIAGAQVVKSKKVKLVKYEKDNEAGSSRNMPMQRYVEQGLFEVKESNVQNPDGSVRITRTTKVSGKGQLYFVNKFLGREIENGRND